jgi:hypothetical protein
MIVGQREIQTPFISEGDDPLNVACDWPHQVAVAMHDQHIVPSKMPKVIRDAPECDFICRHVEFLKAAVQSNVAARRKYNLNCIANAWFTRQNDSAARDYLDPMLLGGASYALIAELCGQELLGEQVPADLIVTYEKLFYHCRTEDGVAVSSPIRRRMLALGGQPRLGPNASEQDQWKAIAAVFDYPVLVEHWGFWDVDINESLPDDVRFKRQKRYGQTHMYKRILAGAVDDEYMLALVSQGMDNERQQFDMGQGTSDNGWAMLLGRILTMVAPELAPLPRSEDDIRTQHAALERKLAAQRAVHAIDVSDAGPTAGRDARNKQIQAHLAAEAARQETPKQ